MSPTQLSNWLGKERCPPIGAAVVWGHPKGNPLTRHLFFLSLKHSFHWLAPLSTLASHYESSWLKERKGRQAPGLCARGLEKTAIHSESLINLEAVDSMCLLLAPSTATIAFLTRLSAEREEK